MTFFVAYATGHLECARLLLDRNADIESKNDMGVTALFAAIVKKQLECVRLLLDYNADINSKNCDGTTVLIIAVGNDYY